ncbi:MAG: aminopeptidase [Oligoflexales bacterium]|nr:aminopeptidase [Oligoflexales bacterium]
MPDIRVKRLADLLVRYSLDVKPGQLVMLRSSTTASELITEAHRAILAQGGRSWPSLSVPGMEYIYYKHASDEVLSTYHPFEKDINERIDALLAVDCKTNSRELSNVDHSRVALSRKVRMPLRDILDKKEMEGRFRWVVGGFPSEGMAQDAGMSFCEFSDFVFESCGCHLEDPVSFWREKSREMHAAHKLLEGVKKIRMVGHKTDLTLSVEGRKWIICDGRVNMPDGEIFTSPVENSACGEVFFDIPTTYSGVEAGGIHLRLDKGRVTSASAEKGEDFLSKMLDMDEGSKFLGEIAFGVNDFIQKPCKSILFDEKIGGTMHIAVGASYPEAGGKNKSGLHWDMIKEMKQGGYVEADGKRIYENGKFIF